MRLVNMASSLSALVDPIPLRYRLSLHSAAASDGLFRKVANFGEGGGVTILC